MFLHATSPGVVARPRSDRLPGTLNEPVTATMVSLVFFSPAVLCLEVYSDECRLQRSFSLYEELDKYLTRSSGQGYPGRC